MGCTVIGRSNYTQIKLKDRQFFVSVCLVSRSLVSKLIVTKLTHIEKMIYLRLISAYENFKEHFQPQSQRVIIIRSRNEVNEIFLCF